MKKLFTTCFATFFFLLVFAQEWEHLSPIKSTDRLKSSFVLNDSTAYMAGWFGRLVKTTNGGQSWDQMDDVTGYPINGGIWGMHFPNENIGYIADDAGRIYKTEDGSASWTQIYLSTSSNFYDSHFFNSDTGFVCGEFGELLKTVDGGDTWNSIPTGVTTRLYDFCFTSDSVGYIALRSGDVLQSTDSGNTWASLGLLNENDLYHIEFANEDLGITVGLYGTILRTTDGGDSWDDVVITSSDRLTSVLFHDENIVTITGDYGLILRSEDGGETFTELESQTPYNLWGQLLFTSGLSYVFGDRVVFESTDQGNNWEYRFDGVPEAQLMRIIFTEDSVAHSVGRTAFGGNSRNAIIKSKDKGRVWHTSYESFGSTGDITDISFIDTDNGFASAYNTIRATTDAGESNWSYLNEEGYFTAIHFFDNDTGLVGNTLDGIFQTTDGGNNWTQVDWCADVNHFHFLDRDTGYAATDGGSIRKTIDGGDTWVNLNVGVTYNFQSVFFANDSTGYAVGDWSGGVKTIDYGTTWTPIPINQYGRDIFCPDPNNPDSVYVLLASGEIRKSIDGGINWVIAVEDMNNQEMWDFEFHGPYIYVCGDHGDILRTRILPCENSVNTIDTTVCDLFISPWGEEFEESGIYEYTYQNEMGCDSQIILDLTINESQYVGTNEVACNSFTDANGEIYTEGGMYEVVLETINGCDSVITMDLTINSVNIEVVDNSPTLIAEAQGASYQWLNCSEGYVQIDGETNQSFTATSNGEYAVTIVQDNCMDTSICFLVNNSSIDQHTTAIGARIYPNPASGKIRVEFSDIQVEVRVSIKNELGQECYRNVFSQRQKLEIELDEKGVFIIEFINEKDEFSYYKIINN